MSSDVKLGSKNAALSRVCWCIPPFLYYAGTCGKPLKNKALCVLMGGETVVKLMSLLKRRNYEYIH